MALPSVVTVPRVTEPGGDADGTNVPQAEPGRFLVVDASADADTVQRTIRAAVAPVVGIDAA